MSNNELDSKSGHEKTPQPAKKKKKWLKVLLSLFVLFCLLIVGTYFYIGSESFVRSQVFARLEQKLNQPVSAETIQFSPLSGLELKNFILGDDPMVKAETVRVRYDLMAMLNGTIKVDEITLENVALKVIVNRDGKLNIMSDAVEEIVPEANKSPDKETTAKNEPQKLPQLNIKNINFKNLDIFVFLDNSDKEKQLELKLENLSFAIPEIANGKDLEFKLEAAINCRAGEKFKVKQGLVKVSGQSKLSADILPESVGMELNISGLNAENESVQLPLKAIGLLLDVDIDGKKTNIKSLRIGTPEKQDAISMSGIVNENDIDLNLSINNVDSSILDLALIPLAGNEALSRWQKELAHVSQGKIAGFGDTMVNLQGSVKGNLESVISTTGQLSIDSLPMVQMSSKSSLVPVSTKVDYGVNLHKKPTSGGKNEQIIELQKLFLSVKDNNSELANLNLSAPVKVNTQTKKLSSSEDSQVTFTLNNFDLNLLKAFMKESSRGQYEQGLASAEIILQSRNEGNEQQLMVKKLDVKELTLKKDKQSIPDVNFKTSARLSLNDPDKIKLQNLTSSINQRGKELVSLSASGLINIDTVEANINVSSLKVHPHEITASFIPATVKADIGPENINLASDKLIVHYSQGIINAEGRAFIRNLGLTGSKMPASTAISSSTSFEGSFDTSTSLATIDQLQFELLSKGQKALQVQLSGRQSSQLNLLAIKLSELTLHPGLSSLLPADLTSKFGLQNIKARSTIDINYEPLKESYVKGNFTLNNLDMAGTQFKPFSLFQSLDIDVTMDPEGLVKIATLHSKTKPSASGEISIITTGQVDRHFQRDDSVINIDVPTSIDLDRLLSLMQKAPQASSPEQPSLEQPATKKASNQNTDVKKDSAPKAAVKLTVKTSVNEVVFAKQAIKGIRATASVNGDNYTLKEGLMQIGDAILKASGKMTGGPTKSMNVNLTSSGPVDISPLNNILNEGSNKSLSGAVTIQQLDALTSGQNNDEFTKNLQAVGKIRIQDLKIKNYASVPAFGGVLDTVLGVNPENLEFQEGLVDVRIANGILTLNQMSFEGKSMAFNPRGTIDLNNNTYDIRMKTAAGFGGGSLIQTITSNPALVELINSKSKELQKFQQKFPYDPAKKKFVMKDDFLFNKELKLSNEGEEKSLLQNLSGLNNLTSDFLITMFAQIGQQANMKEATAIANTLSGKGNVLDNLLNIGDSLLKKELKDKEDNKQERSSEDPVKDILNIFGPNKEKETKKEAAPQEEKKKEPAIDKENKLIKEIENIFR